MIDSHLNLVFNKVTDIKLETLKEYDNGRVSYSSMMNMIAPNINIEKEKELIKTPIFELGRHNPDFITHCDGIINREKCQEINNEFFVQYKNQTSC
jgi:hypothetical protein